VLPIRHLPLVLRYRAVTCLLFYIAIADVACRYAVVILVLLPASIPTHSVQYILMLMPCYTIYLLCCYIDLMRCYIYDVDDDDT